MDEIFIERLWRSMKHEAVYLQDIPNGFVAQHIADDWIGFYNRKRPHSVLGGNNTDEAYEGKYELEKAA